MHNISNQIFFITKRGINTLFYHNSFMDNYIIVITLTQFQLNKAIRLVGYALTRQEHSQPCEE